MKRNVVVFGVVLAVLFWFLFAGKYSNEYTGTAGCNSSMGEAEEGYCIGFVVDLPEPEFVPDGRCLVSYSGSECEGFRFFVKVRRWGTFDGYIRATFAALLENVTIK